MNTYREIEAQPHPGAIQPLPQVVELPSRERLRHQVISLFLRVQVLDAEPSRPCRLGPAAPIPAEPLLCAAKMRVAYELTVPQCLLGNRLVREGGAYFCVYPRHIQCLHGTGRAMGALEIEDQLRPEQPAHGRVRTRIGWVGIERGK